MTARPDSWHTHHYIPPDTVSVLDVGCNVGAGLELAAELGVERLYGIEINPDAAEKAARRLAALRGLQVRVEQGSADHLPFPDSSADVAICSEVLEHVPEELRPAVVREISRVLRPDGLLILTVPAAGAFAFLDPANVRLRWPGLFRLATRWSRKKGREAGYEGQKHGIVWHHHFSLEELTRLLGRNFETVETRFRGCILAPLTNWAQFPFYRLNAQDNLAFKAMNQVMKWEMSKDPGEKLGYNVLLVVRNKKAVS